MGDREKTTLLHCCTTSMPIILIIIGISVTLYYYNIIHYATLEIFLALYFAIFIIGPLLYKFSYRFQRSTIFFNFVRAPFQPDLKSPSKHGLQGVLNFYVETDENITLGVWHIVPEELANDSEGKDRNYYQSLLNNGQNIVIYNHGNSGNRSASHRVELYKVLRMHFHVIAFDYRSYGDSTNVSATEFGAVTDSLYVFKWVRGLTSSKIFIWGHSLGTAISTHMLALANQENIQASGLILESPFNNMTDEIRHHPMAKLFHCLPWFNYTVIEPLQQNNLLFKTDEHIRNVDCPILILHAKDDRIVPFNLGLKLFYVAKENRLETQGTVHFYPFEETCGYGHKYIYSAPELDDVIRNFVMHCVKGERKASYIS